MRSGWVRSRFHLRSGWRATCGLILVVGLAGSLVLAGFAGARRSEHALPEFIGYSRPADILVYLYRDNLGAPTAAPFTPPDDPGELTEALEQIRALPEVASAYRGSYALIAGVDDGSPSGYNQSLAHLHFDPGGSDAFGQALILAGRLATGRRARRGRDRRAVRRATRFTRRFDVPRCVIQPAADRRAAVRAVAPAHAARDLRVVGIVRRVRDLLPPITDQTASSVREDEIYLTPAYYAALDGDILLPGVAIAVRLRNGPGDVQKLTATSLACSEPPRKWRPTAARENNLGEEEKRSLERAVTYEANGLRLFAALVAIAAAVFVGQALVRQDADEGRDDGVFAPSA